jgi:hypothetical protein
MAKEVWLGPPDTRGLKPLAFANGTKNGKWKWRENKLSDKQKKKHDKFQTQMKKADKKDIWRF